MDRRLPIATACCLAALLPWPVATGVRPRPAPGVGGIVLERINELRRTDIVETGDQMSMFDRPGLTLRFGVELPGGRRLVDLKEPARVTAADSTGHDLTMIEKNFIGRRQHVELIQVWNESPREFKFNLTLPDRQARRSTWRRRLTSSATPAAGR